MDAGCPQPSPTYCPDIVSITHGASPLCVTPSPSTWSGLLFLPLCVLYLSPSPRPRAGVLMTCSSANTSPSGFAVTLRGANGPWGLLGCLTTWGPRGGKTANVTLMNHRMSPIGHSPHTGIWALPRTVHPIGDSPPLMAVIFTPEEAQHVSDDRNLPERFCPKDLVWDLCLLENLRYQPGLQQYRICGVEVWSGSTEWPGLQQTTGQMPSKGTCGLQHRMMPVLQHFCSDAQYT